MLPGGNFVGHGMAEFADSRTGHTAEQPVLLGGDAAHDYARLT